MSNPVSPNQHKNDIAEQYRTQKMQREELLAAQEAELENLKKNFVAEKAAMEDRFEQSTQAERLSHYDYLRNQKNQLNREERRMDDTAKALLSQKENLFRHEATRTEQEGRDHLMELQRKNMTLEELERNRALDARQEVATRHKNNAELIISNSKKQVEDLRTQREKFLENEKAIHAQSLIDMQSHYDGVRTGVNQQYSEEVRNLQQGALDDLNTRRLVNSTWIKQYADRAKDPFYRLARFDSQMQDNGDAFQLRVKVPSYERGQFRVQISGQEIQIMGVRTNNENVEVEPGRWVSTSSHQNISERFKLDAPVDGRAMTMKEDGDYLVYHFPKFGSSQLTRELIDQKKVLQEERAVMKQLDFPKSLPKPTVTVDKSGKGPLSNS